MADELTIQASIAFAKGNASVSTSYATTTFDVAGTKHAKVIQSIGTSEEALILADVGTNGYVLIKNLDTTNFVSLRRATTEGDMVRLRAGEFCIFRFDADCTAPFAIADTAACEIEMTLIEA